MKYIVKFLFQFFIVFGTFLAAGILDFLFSVVGEIFEVYSFALFLVTFGVGGIFAAVFTISPPDYFKGKAFSPGPSFIFNILIGLLYYFPFRIFLSDAEYSPALRAFSILFVAASVFFYWLYKNDKRLPEKGGKYVKK